MEAILIQAYKNNQVQKITKIKFKIFNQINL